MSDALLISVHDLINKPGTMREKQLDVVIDEPMANFAIGIPAGSTIEIDARFESVHEGVLVTGDAFATASGECSRCLDPIDSAVEVEFQELFAYSGTSEDDFVVENESIDLDQVIRDAVVLSLPFQPVCSAGCKGLCVTCGAKLNDDPQHAHEAPVDPRWNALTNLKED
ncbi:MAG: hypothetical protein RIR46_715 [Actinomycetota bacterium]|jgi:uncharacterized protein